MKYDFENAFTDILKRKRRSDSINFLLEYYGPMAEENNIKQHIGEDPFYDYVTENLQSHDANLLARKVKEYFGDKVSDVSINSRAKKLTMIAVYMPDTSFVNDKDFNNLLNFFNFYVTYVDGNWVICEPKYTEQMNDYIMKRCKNFVFHITSVKNEESIDNNGLRIRSDTYRKFPDRIYIAAVPDIDNGTLYKRLDLFSKHLGFNDKSEYACYQIDTRPLNITFYEDDTMRFNENDLKCGFTYNNIPTSVMKKINVKV